eukprot:CAMPEP_0204278602 /NCGR_PEP_ID=MMETSP0468-20130131/31645_1 /ASSEMBLY_ACC=CAM_ASM_000383 /TAXON_ID=2969 /ORGANISM="Oxyrrhis marina" /LENGTH=57 /DNA_ID=CAMNT_0051255533 /DNA_START=1 /DNA_END=174 /DNA_ORIENTATION=-
MLLTAAGEVPWKSTASASAFSGSRLTLLTNLAPMRLVFGDTFDISRPDPSTFCKCPM